MKRKTCGTCSDTKLVIRYRNANKMTAFSYGTYDVYLHKVSACPDCAHPARRFIEHAVRVSMFWRDDEGISHIEMDILADLLEGYLKHQASAVRGAEKAINSER